MLIWMQFIFPFSFHAIYDCDEINFSFVWRTNCNVFLSCFKLWSEKTLWANIRFKIFNGQINVLMWDSLIKGQNRYIKVFEVSKSLLIDLATVFIHSSILGVWFFYYSIESSGCQWLLFDQFEHVKDSLSKHNFTNNKEHLFMPIPLENCL